MPPHPPTAPIASQDGLAALAQAGFGWPELVAAWALVALAFGVLWGRQRRTRNATSVDAAWAAAIGMLGVAAAVLAEGAPVQRWLAGAMAALWSGRLTLHLLRDRVFGHAGEDGRYRAMREHWGAAGDRNFFWFYQAQAIAALVFALPFLAIAATPAATPTPLQSLGLGVLVLAQLLEGLADRQLAAHRHDPSRRHLACRIGLWRYSRHPNYFFEWISWCGIALLAAPTAGWLAALQPVLMFLLVRFVSGVPWTELQSLKSRGADYRLYMQQTSTFLPWWPRRSPGTPS